MGISEIISFIQTYKIIGLTLDKIIMFLIFIILTLIASRVLSLVVIEFIKKQTSKTNTEYDDQVISIMEKPVVWLIYVIGFYCAFFSLGPTNDILPLKAILTGGTETLVAMILTWLCFDLIEILDKFLVGKFKQQEKSEAAIVHFFPLFKRSLKVVIAFVALIIIIQNRGYSVSSLLTGFGITGLAVGFAAKESIANIFGSFSVIVDQAYKVGDWIVVDKSVAGTDVEGIVEDITLRSTKIRAFDDTLIVIPNNQAANSTIKNVSRHRKRRIYEYIDITYDTPPEKIQMAVDICRKVVEEHPGMLEYKQIHLNQMAAHSLRIILYIFTKTNDWGEYLKIRHELFLRIISEFNAQGIEFAFPTQTLYLNRDSGIDVNMVGTRDFN